MDEDKIYKLDNGGIVKLDKYYSVFSLDEFGEWEPNQYALSLFADDPVEMVRITEEQLKEEIKKIRRTEGRTYKI